MMPWISGSITFSPGVHPLLAIYFSFIAIFGTSTQIEAVLYSFPGFYICIAGDTKIQNAFFSLFMDIITNP